MEELKKILEKLESMEERLCKLEGSGEKQCDLEKMKFKNVVNPKDMELGTMAFVGKFQSKDGKLGSEFGYDRFEIGSLYDCNSFEMAKVIDAFANEDRINIIKELMTRDMTAKALMEKLEFQTTGKLYHHLSFLEKIGILRKDSEFYHINSRYISCIILIAVGVAQIVKKNND